MSLLCLCEDPGHPDPCPQCSAGLGQTRRLRQHSGASRLQTWGSGHSQSHLLACRADTILPGGVCQGGKTPSSQQQVASWNSTSSLSPSEAGVKAASHQASNGGSSRLPPKAHTQVPHHLTGLLEPSNNFTSMVSATALLLPVGTEPIQPKQ